MNTREVIGFPRESTPGDRRTLLTPTVARVLTEAGFTVIAEPGIATGVNCPDIILHASGVRFTDASEVWSAPLILRYKCADPDDLSRLAPDQSIGALPSYAAPRHCNHGDAALNALRAEVQRGAAELRRPHRAYTVDYLAGLLPRSGPCQVHFSTRIRRPCYHLCRL